MQGRGVTNYSTEKPSVAYSTRTTEFDDALVERGIVTLEQAFMAKGMSQAEAHRMASLKRKEDNAEDEVVLIENKKESKKESGDDDESEDFSEEDDDEFLERYRRLRLQELKRQSEGPFGQVLVISRPEWTRQVNEASHDAWVVVTLTSTNVERTGCVEAAVHSLAPKFPTTKFVSIPSSAAIANWPDKNLPTVFLYRNGKLQRELIRLETNITADALEWDLAQNGVLETDLEERPSIGGNNDNVRGGSSYGGSSIFGGQMAQLATRAHESDDDYDSDGE